MIVIVIVWGIENYFKKMYKLLSNEEVYEEVTFDSSNFESTIFTALNKIRNRGDLSTNTMEYFFSIKTLNLLDFVCY